ncbi:hypothetical protein SAMN05421754_10482 [Nitrosomonas sp. Nm58]|nr:hypothetical protein SAMN05421754_10482 [Nitrosomonas sp. Nm58]
MLYDSIVSEHYERYPSLCLIKDLDVHIKLDNALFYKYDVNLD